MKITITGHTEGGTPFSFEHEKVTGLCTCGPEHRKRFESYNCYDPAGYYPNDGSCPACDGNHLDEERESE